VTLTDKGNALRLQARAIPESVICATSCEMEKLQSLKGELEMLRNNLNS